MSYVHATDRDASGARKGPGQKLICELTGCLMSRPDVANCALAQSAVRALKRSEVRHTLRIGGSQRRGTLGLRRIDPDSVDLLLRRLRFFADHLHLAIPAPGEEGSGIAEVKAGDIGFLMILPWRYA